MSIGFTGPSSDWGESSGASEETQEFGCVWCAGEGVIDNPKTIYMYKGQSLCINHLQTLQSLETE